ncbi:MAG: translation initiation factor IF-2 subunit beta [Candidatus Aenigmarchaeota archaeon]|nr:translation initiation factor IF-2 subunit beta [Candidatus Aenigmarchaeota archaeon]
MKTYEEMLHSAFEKLPKTEKGTERLEVPEPELLFQGTSTIVKNFSPIAKSLRREPKHLLKFLSKELASPGSIDEDRCTFQTKLSARILQQKIESYKTEFVICKECKRPDTDLIMQNRILQLKCQACGARSAVREI